MEVEMITATYTSNVNRSAPDGVRNKGSPQHANIRAKNIMTTDVVWVAPSKSVREVAELMSARKLSAVPVVDDGNVIGIVSEGDLIQRAELGTATNIPGQISTKSNVDYSKSHGTHASDVMSRNVVTVIENATLSEIAETMQTRHIKRLPVMRNDKLVGIVSRSDIVKTLAARPEGAGEPMNSDDDIIRFRVIQTLMEMPGTSPWLTSVAVSQGVVTLDGTTQDETVKEPSRIAVEQVPHVVEVRDGRGVLQPY
jgi:CBS domain-containing protein